MRSRSHADLWFMSWSCVQMWSHGSIIRKLMIDDFCPQKRLLLSRPRSLAVAYPSFEHRRLFCKNPGAASHLSNDPFLPVHHIRQLCSAPALLVNTPGKQTWSLGAETRNWCSGDSGNWVHWLQIATMSWFYNLLDKKNPLNINMCQNQRVDAQNSPSNDSYLHSPNTILLQYVDRTEKNML